MFSLSNVRFSDRVDQIPWLHLSPWGLERRSAGGQAPSPLVGWLWIGGGIGLLKEGTDEIGAWHSEYMCLMNGSHDNYRFTQLDGDPTNLPDGTIEGASLRDRTRLCLWCQELVTIRLLEKTDQLLESGDPADITAQGEAWYTRWVQELRANYLEIYDVPGQIGELEASYATLAPGPAGEPLWQSDLYSVPKAAPPVTPPPTAPLTDDGAPAPEPRSAAAGAPSAGTARRGRRPSGLGNVVAGHRALMHPVRVRRMPSVHRHMSRDLLTVEAGRRSSRWPGGWRTATSGRSWCWRMGGSPGS